MLSISTCLLVLKLLPHILGWVVAALYFLKSMCVQVSMADHKTTLKLNSLKRWYLFCSENWNLRKTLWGCSFLLNSALSGATHSLRIEFTFCLCSMMWLGPQLVDLKPMSDSQAGAWNHLGVLNSHGWHWLLAEIFTGTVARTSTCDFSMCYELPPCGWIPSVNILKKIVSQEDVLPFMT